MARVLDKEKVTFLGAVVLGGALAGVAAMSSVVSHDLAFGSGGGGQHTALDPPVVPFVGAGFARYYEEGGANPFTLIPERRDLPPADIALPPVSPSPIEAFPPSPWPAGDAGPWVCFPMAGSAKPSFTLGGEFDAAELQKLVPPPPAPPADAGTPAGNEATDVVIKKDKTQLKGKIESVTDTVIAIKTLGGVVRVKRSDIDGYTWNSATVKQKVEEERRRLDVGDADGHAKLADFCIQNGLLADAIAELQAVLKADPKRAASILVLGDLYHRTMDLEGELALYRRATAAGGSGIDKVWVRLGRLLAQLGLWEDAVAAYDGGAKAFPIALDPKIELALALARVGRFDQAAEEAERAERQGNGDARCAVTRGLVAFAKGDDAGADKLLPAADAATDADAALARGVLSYRAARKDAGKLADAAAAFKKAVTLSATSSEAWVDLGLCLLLAGKTAESELCFKTADDLDPSSSRAQCGLGLLAVAAGKADEAVQRFTEATRRGPGDGYAWYGLGKAQSALATGADDAWKSLLAASRAGARNTDLYASLGLAALAKGDAADAIALLESAVRAGGAPADVQAALGIAYLGRNEGKSALDAFRDALKADQNNIPALNGLGYYYYFAQKGTEAVKQFDAVLQIDPKDEYALAAKAKVTETTTRTLWDDTFQRPDNSTVGRGWVQTSRWGIDIALKDKRVKFSGEQRSEDDKMTVIEREVALKTFLKFEVELDTSGLGEAAGGVRLVAQLDDSGRKGGILFARDEKGKWAWCVADDMGTLLRWKPLPVGPDQPVFKMAIQRMETETQQMVFAFTVGGKTIATTPADFLANAKTAMAGVFGSALVHTKWTLSVGSAQIIEKKVKR